MSAVYINGSWYNIGDVNQTYPQYTGSYSVIPSTNEQVLDTQNTALNKNIRVQPIPYQEVSNPSGGNTAIIGS